MQTPSEQWKKRLRDALQGKEALTSDERDSMRAELLRAALAHDAGRPASKSPWERSFSLLRTVHRTGLGYVLTAAAAAALAIVVVRPASDRILPEEIATLHHASEFPADFQLSDERRLESELDRILAKQSLPQTRPVAAQDTATAVRPRASRPPMPKQLRGDVQASEGRFVSWRGKAGVSLKLSSPNSSPQSLVIVPLDDEDPVFLPEKHVEVFHPDRLQPARLTTWREDGFGYALFEPQR